MNWLEKFVPDAETCIALFTMNVPQANSTFVWVDTGLVDAEKKNQYHLQRRIDIVDAPKQFLTGVFAAFTAEEFQSILPLNFVPMQPRPGQWIIVDLYGTKLADEASDGMQARQVVMARVNGSNANRPAQAFAQASIFLIQSGALKLG